MQKVKGSNEIVGGFSIKITNFINPHIFHFKLENMVGQMDMDIENALQKCANEIRWQQSTGYQPKQDEIVLAYVIEWGKWARGQVDMILEENRCKQYVVWCLDQGVSVKLNGTMLLPMPAELQRSPQTAFVGGLAKCVPVEKRINFAKMTNDLVDIDDFPDFVVSTARKYIEEAAEIFFLPLQKIGHHIFGDIQITQFNGIKVNLRNELLKRDGIKAVEQNIPFGIENLLTTHKKRYETHLGHLNVRNMVKTNLSSNMKKYASAISVCSNDLDDEEKMVLDWSRRNNEMAKEMDQQLKDSFNRVIDSLDQYAAPNQKVHGSYPRLYSVGSLCSIDYTNYHELERNGSRVPLTEVRSEPTVDPPVTHNSRSMNRLTQRLRESNISNQSPPKANNSKKMVFIPSGFERDFLEFQQLNDMM